MVLVYPRTDRYLLGLSRRYGGCLVTCDQELAVAGGDDAINLLDGSPEDIEPEA